MAISKVVYGNQTLVDLTGDTVEASNLLEGETAHDRSGNLVTGTAKQGHIVQNDSGTDMTQRAKVQFIGVYAEDDSTNDRTKVNIVRPMTKAQMEALTPAQKKGFIRTTDEPDNPYVNYSHHNINLGQNSCPAGISQISTDIPLDAFNVCPYISAYTSGGVRQVILTMMKSSSAWIVCANNVSSTTQTVTISVDYLI